MKIETKHKLINLLFTWIFLVIFCLSFGLIIFADETNKEFSDIILLSKSNITNTVIKAYIDSSTNKYTINATNILSLKKAGVADDIILHMLNKDKKQVVIVDYPESYDFFYRYYLLPRALSYSYKLTNGYNWR